MASDPVIRAREVFRRVCEEPPERRTQLVEDLCADDEALKSQVWELLRQHHDQPTQASPLHNDTHFMPMLGGPGSRGSGTGPGSGSFATPGGPAERTDRGFAPGTLVAERYRIISRLGRGGMGEVYRADDLVLDQPVALKFLTAEVGRDPRWLQRLQREVRIARQVTHPSVCRVYDIGQAAGEQFISMEYIDGENLAQLLKRIGHLPQDRGVQLAQQLCAGLAAAHGRAVLHRDLKPANVMLDSAGQIRITDFGLAAAPEDLAGSDVRSGTPAYMAPEQITGREVTLRSDIYSLGLVLYELFTGRPAMTAERVADLLHRGIEPRIAPPSTFMPTISPAVERVIMRCLEADPARRYPSVLAVAGALPGGDALACAIAAGETPSPELVAAAGDERCASLRWTVGALAVFAALLVTLLVFPWNLGQAPPWEQDSKDPAVLAERARQLVARVAPLGVAGDDAYGLVGGGKSALISDTEADAAAPPYAMRQTDPVRFWYRAGADQLLPVDATNLVYGPGTVTLEDPPPGPGDRTVVLTPGGRLVGFQADLSRQRMEAVSGDGPESALFGPLLEAADVDITSLVEREAEYTPRVAADRLLAWDGRLASAGGHAVRIEAALLGGRPVSFAVLAAHPRNPAAMGVRLRTPEQRQSFVNHLQHALLIVLIVAALPLAHLSVTRGRGDLLGSLRLAGFVFAVRLLMWVLQARHVASFDVEVELLGLALLGAMGEAAIVWLFYVALEPYVRQYWPQTLIAWHRALAGRLSDPLVGRNLLLGVILGVFWAIMLQLDQFLTNAVGLTARTAWRDAAPLLPLLEGRYAVAQVLDAARYAIYQGLFLLLVTVLLRTVLKRAWLANLAAFVVIAPMFVPRGAHPFVSWIVIGLGCLGVGLWVLQRFGLMPLVAATFTVAMLFSNPLSLNLQAWYGDAALLSLGVVTALAVYGFLMARRSGRPALDGGYASGSHSGSFG